MQPATFQVSLGWWFGLVVWGFEALALADNGEATPNQLELNIFRKWADRSQSCGSFLLCLHVCGLVPDSFNHPSFQTPTVLPGVQSLERLGSLERMEQVPIHTARKVLEESKPRSHPSRGARGSRGSRAPGAVAVLLESFGRWARHEASFGDAASCVAAGFLFLLGNVEGANGTARAPS